VGIYYVDATTIYKCTGTSNIKCENKYSATCTTGTAGSLTLNANNKDIDVCNGSTFVSIKFDITKDKGYRKILKSDGIGIFAFGVSDDILVKVDKDERYAVKGKYFLLKYNFLNI